MTEWFRVEGVLTPSPVHVNVTVCGIFQLAGVNRRGFVDVIVSPVSGKVATLTDRGILTLAVGWLFKRTVKLSPRTDSKTPELLGFVRINPVVSLSEFVAFKEGIVAVNAVSPLIAPKFIL